MQLETIHSRDGAGAKKSFCQHISSPAHLLACFTLGKNRRSNRTDGNI